MNKTWVLALSALAIALAIAGAGAFIAVGLQRENNALSARIDASENDYRAAVALAQQWADAYERLESEEIPALLAEVRAEAEKEHRIAAEAASRANQSARAAEKALASEKRQHDILKRDAMACGSIVSDAVTNGKASVVTLDVRARNGGVFDRSLMTEEEFPIYFAQYSTRLFNEVVAEYKLDHESTGDEIARAVVESTNRELLKCPYALGNQSPAR